MKILFEDKSYIEIKKSDNAGKIMVIISAKNHDNPLKKTTNAVELDVSQFKELISDLNLKG
jgi:nitrate reductase NapAB chaperone NapD